MKSSNVAGRALALSLAAGILAIATPARAEEEFNPFHVPRERVQQVHTIAIRPVIVDERIENRSSVQKTFEPLVEAAAKSAGYAVVPASTYTSVWRANAIKLGGLYDPSTGDLDEKKFDTCYEYTARELARTSNVDAILTALISKGRHHSIFVQHFATMKAYSYGKPIVLNGKELTTDWIQQIQYLEGTFFGLALLDGNGRTMFGMRLPIEWRRIYWRRGYDDKTGPAFADAAKNQQVVARTFSWLSRGTDLPSAQ